MGAGMTSIREVAKAHMRRRLVVMLPLSTRLRQEVGGRMAVMEATVALFTTVCLSILQEALRMGRRHGQWTTGLEGVGPCTIGLRQAAQEGQVEVASTLQRMQA